MDEVFEWADPREVGLDPARLARIGRFLGDEIAADRMPGAVLGIVRDGRLAFLEAFGHRDRARGLPMTTDSLFWIASMTKPITAVGALLLHEQGRLTLDTPVGAYLPEFANRLVAGADGTSRPATRQPSLVDLLRHTAGLPEGLLGDTDTHRLYAEAVGDGMTDLTGQEFIDRLAALPLLHEPGALWHYGWGLDLIGLIIESLTGERLGDYLRHAVFEPLGMRDTTFGVSEKDRFAQPLPHDPLTGEPQSLPDLGKARFDSGGAGLVSTVPDYLRFLRVLLDKGHGLLGRKTVEFMLSDQLEPGTDLTRLHKPGWNPRHGFGLALAVRREVGDGVAAGSPGEVTWPGAAGTTWWADPAEDLGVAFFAHTPSAIQSRYHQQIKALVLQALR
ncbi:CubicO group peptidase, beta-lactamase class C family [Amycolatopsis xylanica]|uniref:CubicO group peptidase, beta-lactamase class C family n=1 Tax=Amycolatopsis xylanica TaxID=589385 RepID=A0A1H3NSK9_9PSEU|nr:serine hydrolase domain-containing protein [Amycolatopsis xylanica]SDY91680.1 CubicO group peptidase, beta-lactamase class C family [Amycolatopsis xylanica]